MSAEQARPSNRLHFMSNERVLEVVSGTPTPEELAAVVTVLSSLAGQGDRAAGESPRSAWSSPASRLRTAYGPRPGGWRSSGLPR